MIVGGEIFEAKIVAVDGVNQGRGAQGALRVGAGSQRGTAGDPAGPYDAGMSGLDGLDEGGAALNPLAFPTHLAEGIIREIGAPEAGRGLGEAPERVVLE